MKVFESMPPTITLNAAGTLQPLRSKVKQTRNRKKESSRKEGLAALQVWMSVKRAVCTADGENTFPRFLQNSCRSWQPRKPTIQSSHF